MKILVLGGRGMAGHMIVDYFHKRTEHDIFYTSRDRDDKEGFFLDVRDPDKTRTIDQTGKSGYFNQLYRAVK